MKMPEYDGKRSFFLWLKNTKVISSAYYNTCRKKVIAFLLCLSRRLNAELEERTANLIKEAEEVMVSRPL